MKVIILSLFLTGLALGNLVSLGSGCPDQQVANSQGICIRPSYIEGCDVYKNVEECDTCKNGTFSFIQVMKTMPTRLANVPWPWKPQRFLRSSMAVWKKTVRHA